MHTSLLKYREVEEDVRRFVQTLPVGSKIPSERNLAISHGCNFLTVRKALKGLVAEGTLVRRVGSGTFIARHIERGSSAGPKDARVGVLVYQGGNAYAYRVLQSIAHASIDLKINLRLIWLRDFDGDALSWVNLLKKDQCVALTLPWFPLDRLEEVRRFVSNCPLPVSLPMVIPGVEKNCFEQEQIYDASGATMAMEDICKFYRLLGHDRIVLIGPDSADDPILQKKVSGYIHYAARENMPSICGLIGPGAAAVDRLAQTWKSYRGNLAIISYDDEHAVRFMTAMHKIGLKAPNDYCIIGYNDTDGSRYSDPPLTTVHQNFDYIGYWMLKSALALGKGEVCQAAETPKLKMLVRDSCGGRSKITDLFCSQFENIDIALDHNVPISGE